MNVDPLDALLDELADRVTRRLHELQSAAAPVAVLPSPWLSIKSAAAYLDWPAQRLYKLTAQNAIPHVKHDGRLLFHRDQLDHWLTRHAQGDWMLSPEPAISG